MEQTWSIDLPSDFSQLSELCLVKFIKSSLQEVLSCAKTWQKCSILMFRLGQFLIAVPLPAIIS